MTGLRGCGRGSCYSADWTLHSVVGHMNTWVNMPCCSQLTLLLVCAVHTQTLLTCTWRDGQDHVLCIADAAISHIEVESWCLTVSQAWIWKLSSVSHNLSGMYPINCGKTACLMCINGCNDQYPNDSTHPHPIPLGPYGSLVSVCCKHASGVEGLGFSRHI